VTQLEAKDVTNLSDIQETSGKKQLVVANTTINDFEREKGKKNLIIYGVTESTKITLTKKKAEDEQKLESILTAIGKSEVKPAYLKRLKIKRFI
jgi:hypothetical protein